MMDKQKAKCSLRRCLAKITFRSITWWILLVVSVLAIAAFALLLAATVHSSGISELVIFTLTCWLCAYFGLRMIKNSRLTPVLFEQVTLSAQAKQHCIQMISAIAAEMEQWQQRYEKYEPVLMNFSRQPAWGYLDEIMRVLWNVRQSAEKDGTVAFADVKALDGWVESSKPDVVEAYLQGLKATYGYAKAEFSQQGKNIDELFPELGKGQMDTLTGAPSSANSFAQELLATIRAEHPLLAESNLKDTPAKA